jgi:hypothetical protein
VCGVILDPSCSGSGTIVSRMDHLLPQGPAATGTADDASRAAAAADNGEQRRVEQLAKFQVFNSRMHNACMSSNGLRPTTSQVHQWGST